MNDSFGQGIDDEWAKAKVEHLIAYCQQAHIPGAQTSYHDMTLWERDRIVEHQRGQIFGGGQT